MERIQQAHERLTAPTPIGCDIGQVVGSPCPVCDAPLQEEHAHTRCRSCGWLGKCCE